MLGDFNMGGWWIIFPIFGFIVMLTFMFMMMGRMGFRGPRRDSRMDSRMESHEPGRSETPLEILNTRYAKGEISKEEYEEMKKALS